MSDKNGGGDGQQQRLAADWTRPAGPANVWRVIEAEERLKDASVPVRLSIQEVPDDRHEEAVRHMCQYFIVDEVTCRSLSTYVCFLPVSLFPAFSAEQQSCILARLSFCFSRYSTPLVDEHGPSSLADFDFFETANCTYMLM